MDEYRYVCLKDLDNYFKIDNYLGGLSSEEYKRIKSNSGINVISGNHVMSDVITLDQNVYLYV